MFEFTAPFYLMELPNGKGKFVNNLLTWAEGKISCDSDRRPQYDTCHLFIYSDVISSPIAERPPAVMAKRSNGSIRCFPEVRNENRHDNMVKFPISALYV